MPACWMLLARDVASLTVGLACHRVALLAGLWLRHKPRPLSAAAIAAGPRQYSRKVEKLRGICKAATITIPPSLYVKNKGDDELAAALEALLEKHELDGNAGGWGGWRGEGGLGEYLFFCCVVQGVQRGSGGRGWLLKH